MVAVKRTDDTRFGTVKRRSRHDVRLAVKTITAAYTVTLADHTLLCDASGGAFTVTLPEVALANGQTFNIKKTDSSAFAVTVVPA